LWGRTWDGGGITLSYEWYDEAPVYGTAHSKYTQNYSPWGLDDRRPITGAYPGIISTGAPATTFPGGFPATVGTYCTNCFSIPAGNGTAFNPINGGIGPTAPFSASQLNWTNFNVAGNSGTNGTRNIFEAPGTAMKSRPYSARRDDCIDQRLTKNISFFGGSYYAIAVSNLPTGSHQPVTNNTFTTAVPTFNPYYPTGGAPTNLRVSYDIGKEIPPQGYAYELSDRYAYGLNIDLPGGWTGQIYDSRSFDANVRYEAATINKNAVSAALGWTINAALASGTAPGIATWTRPANVPYLDLFCDPTAVQCNSPTTLNYVTGFRGLNERVSIDERGVKFDGPLFELPAGQIKAAVGGNYVSFNVNFVRAQNTGGSLILPTIVDAEPYNVWAGFAQVNVPVFGANYNIPLFRKLIWKRRGATISIMAR
jgi:hypothetical protein